MSITLDLSHDRLAGGFTGEDKIWRQIVTIVDAMRGAFWIASPAARDCCALAGAGYVAPAWFSRPVTIAVRKGDARLLNALDYGLDRLDQSGATGAILNRYVPGGVM